MVQKWKNSGLWDIKKDTQMSASNYPFLERNQKTEEDRQRENIDSLWSQLGAIGVGQGRSFFTGYGNDNKLQEERPTGILNTNKGPKTVHEGERVDIQSGGNFSVTPASQMGGQENLASMEKMYGIEGYEIGTPDKQDDTIPDTTMPENTFKPYQTRGLQRLERYADYDSPMNQAIREGERERFAGEAASAKGALSQELAQADITGREAATEQTRLGRQIGAQESQLMSNLRKQESEQAYGAAIQLPSAATAAASEERIGRQFEQSLDFEEEKFRENMDFAKQKYGDQKFARMADDAQTTSFDTWQQKYPDATRSDWSIAREYKVRQMQGMDVEREIGEATLQGITDQNIINIGNQFLAAKDYNGYANYMKNAAGLDITPEQYEKDLEYSRTIETQQVTAGEISNLAAQNNVNADQLFDTINAINSGATYTTIKDVLGTDISGIEFAKMAESYLTKTAYDKVVLESARNTFGDEKFNSTMDMINSGASLDQLLERYPEMAGTLTPDEFVAMKATTETGKYEFDKQMSAASMLIETGDANNITQAQGVLNDLFPSVSFDFGQMITDIGADRFAASMADINTLAQTYSSWEEAARSVAGLNMITDLGMLKNQELLDRYGDNTLARIMKNIAREDITNVDELNKTLGIDLTKQEYLDLKTSIGNAKSMFEGLQVNALDEEWNAISESDFYKGLLETDPDSAQLIKDTLTAGLTGELEFDITPVYNVVDQYGNFIASFDNMVDAGKKYSEMGGKEAGFNIEADENYVYKNVLTGNSVTVNNAGDVINPGTGDGKETVETTFGLLQSKGYEGTVDDVQAYQDEKGKLPTTIEDMDKWDEGRHDISFWDRMDTNYPEGYITIGGEKPNISLADVNSLVEAKSGGDARATNYFVTDTDTNNISSANKNYESAIDRPKVEQKQKNIAYANQYDNVDDAFNDSVGKLISISELPYVIQGYDGNSVQLYDVTNKDYKQISVDDIIKKGLSTENIKKR